MRLLPQVIFEVNRKRWIGHKDDLQNRYALVTHEYLGIMGIDDKKYQISYQLFAIPGPARFQAKCPAFDDLQGILKNQYFLYFTFYDDKLISIVKSEGGDLLPYPLGDTLTTLGSENHKVYAIVTVNLGLIRSIQIPIPIPKKGRNLPDVQAVVWDSKVFGQISELSQITCEEWTW